MANFRYFADIGGETVELSRPYGMANAEFAKTFEGIKGRPYDGYARLVGRAADGRVLPITRMVEYKSNPSKHVCDARCLHATGKVMKCECSCGGKNHGRGHALVAA